MARESELPGKYGQPIPHDPDFNGPLKYRSCTDVVFLMLFIVFIGCWIGIALYAFGNGNTSAVLAPKDSNGLRCGVDDVVQNKKYLFFFDILKCVNPSVPFLGCPTPQVCVENCPEREGIRVCLNDKTCKESKYPTTNVQGRCIPVLTKNWIHQHSEDAEKIEKAIQNVKLIAETEQFGENVLKDVTMCWSKILYFLLGALFCTLIYIMMLRWIAGTMVWCSLIGLIIALALGVYGSWFKYQKMLSEEREIGDENLVETFHDIKKYFWLTALITCSVSLTIIVLVTIFLRKRINLAITLIEEGSKAITSVTSVLVFPVVPWILQIVVILFALSIGLLLTTTGAPVFMTKGNATDCPLAANKVCDPKTFQSLNCPEMACKLIKMKHNDFYNYLVCMFVSKQLKFVIYLSVCFLGFNIFGFFWGSFFVSAFSQMVLATVFATWYWTKPRRNLPFFAVTSAASTVLRYHIGTLAFGALIISICRMIRLVLEFIDRKLKKYDNEVTRAILCILKCFFWCLEKVLKFISTNAYIMCAIHGKNFCSSAKHSFSLLFRNMIRFVILDKVTDFLFFVSTLLISIGLGVVAYIFFATDLTPSDNSNLNYVEVPIVLIVLFTYFISKIFFHVYSMAVDTLFLCFLEDCERNDGSPDKPYYMSKDLMKIFGKKNKKE
ncbi:choline transporter-like 2 isoform X2 [Harmonia axyridis]|uniref:choline transporter-like 2 isoform X2 n=1 Tax=Harmonia axyridis TaxID=115357 RepID=UPI001E278078|nr:choline transporter-like 2 isoform X2 [Harmonia axyridis]